MNWQKALSEIAKVATECVAVRKAGFTVEALAFPRDALALDLLCAFNGVDPVTAPNGWRFFPNLATKQAWNRVAGAALAYYYRRWHSGANSLVSAEVT